MKAINSKIGTVLLALIFSVSVQASTGGGTQSKVAAQKEIQSHLNIPVEKNERVEVVFTTDKTGRVNLAIAKTADKKLQRTVESEFSRLQLSGLSAGDCYSVILNLKLI
ncbi:MAG: hypothetical protein ACXVP0_12660 [Bacteroidia bacterium]